MRAERGGIVLLCLAAGCALLTRPEGDGGWSPERRREEIAARAERAAVPIAATPVQAPSARPLTLAEALAQAARANRPIVLASRQVDAAAARVREVRGRLLPAVTGSGRYGWYSASQTVQTPFPSPTGGIEIREDAFGTVAGTATVPVDVWGELRHTLRAAQAGYRGERARLWATTLDQQVAVVTAYYRLLEAERLRQVTEQTLALDREQLAHAEQRFAAGRLTKNELLVVQVRLASDGQQLVRRTLAVDQARWQLNDVLGLPVDAPTAVVDVAERPVIPPAGEVLDGAAAHNPVLVALLEEQQRLDDTVRALERSRFPQFSGGGAVDASSSDLVLPQTIGSGFVGFSWDLGTDGRREARIAEARIQADRNRTAMEQELRQIEAAVRLTQRAAEERLAALAAAEVAVTQAAENLRIRRQQFDAGRATSDDVLDAEALLAGQRATLATALYQAHTRRAELQQLMGLPVER